MDGKAKRSLGQSSSKARRSHDEGTYSVRVGKSGKERARPGKDAEDALTKHEHRSSRPKLDIEPYTTLGRLSYAPATQTTVVTTTTTTTTSFPPLIMNPPRPLDNRDPKQYPLALTPTPQSLRRIELDINGRPARFEEESEDALQVLTEVWLFLSTLGPLSPLATRPDTRNTM